MWLIIALIGTFLINAIVAFDLDVNRRVTLWLEVELWDSESDLEKDEQTCQTWNYQEPKVSQGNFAETFRPKVANVRWHRNAIEMLNE